jgi:hypothetical protein
MQPESPAPGAAPGRTAAALAAVFLSPTRAFEQVARGAGWLVPFVLNVILTLATALLQRPFFEAMTAAQLARVPEAQREAAAQTAGIQSTFQIVLAPAQTAIAMLLSAGLFVAVSRGFGWRTRFKTLWTGLCYASLVPVAGSVVAGFLTRMKSASGELESMADLPRMGLDLVGGEGFVRGMLAAVNPFSIWWLVIVVYGMRVLADPQARRLAPVGLTGGILWIVLTGLLAGLGFAFGGR